MLQFNESKTSGIKGMDQRLLPESGTMREITNYRVDSSGAFRNDVGWEPLIKILTSTYLTSLSTFRDLFSTTRFLYVWSKHQNAETYYLFERNGILRYEFGNAGTGNREVQLITGRKVPKPDDPGTQAAGYGRLLVLVNGQTMHKFWGRKLVETFGWATRPGAPQVLGVLPLATKSPGGLFLEGNNTAIRFSATEWAGLGFPAATQTSTYGYRVAWISDTGSVSPLSDPYFTSWETATGATGKFAVTLTDVPIGPQGTVGRILYRTKNLGLGSTPLEYEFYEITRIMDNCTTVYIDASPESELSTVPIDPGSSTPIDAGWRYVASWDGRVWLGGGDLHGQQVVYSESGKPEQFRVESFFDLGMREGGQVTALVPFYNSLLVFRERSIEVVTTTALGYQIATLDSNLGTTATNTIRVVPGIGVLFLAQDGVYCVKGGLVGGARYTAEHYSAGLSDEWDRLTKGSLPRASATYSSKEGEYFVVYPCDGTSENSRGAAFHLATEGWSLRNAESSSLDFSFSAMATDPQGWIIMGTAPTRGTTPLTSSSWPGVGLQVWSAEAHWGQAWTNPTLGEQGWTWTIGWRARGESVLESPWEAIAGWGEKESVKHVLIHTLTEGNNSIQLTYGINAALASVTEVAVSTQPSEYYGTSSAQTVLGTNATGPAATWNQTYWEATRLNYLRVDVDASEANTFSWRIQTSNDFSIFGYKLLFQSKGTKTTNQRG